ncbi:MAG TPA: hypothetical protein VKQ36_01660, partial [Ktedonobacterales bacterium]|nr:hypothetical protein [Ktedonobacterales bacterium]
MAEVNAAQIEEYLRQRHIPGLSEPFTIQRRATFAGEQRFRVSSTQSAGSSGAAGAVILKRYEPGAVESARRESAGQRLGGEMGLTTPLVLADEAGGVLGGPVII